LYASNRGHDSIALFAIDENTGELTYSEAESTQGKTPRHFECDPQGEVLLAANQNSDTLRVYRIDHQSGRLRSIGPLTECPSPVCVKFLKVAGGGN
jgi:6-phosphogluconolactonase